MSSPCPGTDYNPKPGSYIDEPYPGSNDLNQRKADVLYPEFQGPASDPGDESEYTPGLGADNQRRFDADIDINAAYAQARQDQKAAGVYGGEGAAPSTFRVPTPTLRVDPRTVPPKPIEDMTAREFLTFDSRNPNTPSSKRKVFGSLITASDANYQAFIDLVAFHHLDLVGGGEFNMKVAQSINDQLNAAKAKTILDLLSQVGG